MKKTIIALILAVLLACGPVSAYDSGDFQIWHTDSEQVKVAKDVKFVMEQEFRFGENATELFYQHYDFGFVFGFARMLDLGFFYRLALEKYKHKWREEDMPNVNATLKFDLWKFKLEDRSRIEYRHYRFKDDFVRYRNKFALKLPFEFKSIKVLPYIADEVFVASNGTGYNENRFFAGTEFELTKYVKADFYYLLKNNRIVKDKWSSANVFGTKIKISF